ncbi:MAG: hypothetical protein IJX06_02855 [Clostridia bacterium]|nr:hypothetical protein [Clostridia bacterium]
MKKKTKFSLGMKIVTLLTVITMASVGFAAWVITAPVAETYADGTIKVETAEKKENPVKLNAEIVTANGTSTGENVIKFGTKAITSGTDYGWLSNVDIGEENLTVYIKLTITNTGSVAFSNNITATLTTTFAQDSASSETIFEDAMDTDSESGVIAKPTITPIQLAGVSVDIDNIDTATYDTTNNNAVLTIPASKISGKASYTVLLAVKINWGKKFSADGASAGVNAYEFYNKQKYSEGLATAAESNLNDLYTALNGVSYKVTFGVEEQA